MLVVNLTLLSIVCMHGLKWKLLSLLVAQAPKL